MARKKAEETDAAELEGQVQDLFRLPLAEFTAARNALSARLKKAGRGDDAVAIKSLQKPPISAWTVNQLFWEHRPAFDALVDAGQKFRTAQAAQLSGRSADLRGPLDARREALADMSKRAARILRDAGHPASPDVMRRITTTLEALSTYAGLPDAPQPGRLTDDVDPPGFETLAALVPRVGKGGATAGPSRVLPFQQQQAAKKARQAARADPKEAERQREEERRAQIDAARTALQASERALREARRDAERAETQLKKAAAHAKETERVSRAIEQAKAAIDQKYEKAAAATEAARQEARRVAEEAEAAAQAVEDAERELERARQQLTELKA